MSNERKYVVLVADDEPSTVALLGRHLRARGYTVLEANDGDQAWELAHEHLPHLVILDVMMPGMSGWEVCRKIREAVSLAHTGVVMLTGIGEALNEMTSPLYGADAHVDKPFEFADLDRKITQTLERRQAGALGRPDAGSTDDIRLEVRPRDEDEAEDTPRKLPLPRTVGTKKSPAAAAPAKEAAKPLAKAKARPSAKAEKTAVKAAPAAQAKAPAKPAPAKAKPAKATAPAKAKKAPPAKAKTSAKSAPAKTKAKPVKAKAKPKAQAKPAPAKATAPAKAKKAAPAKAKPKAPAKSPAKAAPKAKAKAKAKPGARK